MSTPRLPMICKHCGKRVRNLAERNCPTSPAGGRHEVEDTNGKGTP